MRRVQWSLSALEDLRRQVAHIAADDPDVAAKIARRIRETGTALGDFATGHPGRVAGTYEKSVTGYRYIIAYALTDDQTVVSILHVIHASRDWQDESWPQ